MRLKLPLLRLWKLPGQERMRLKRPLPGLPKKLEPLLKTLRM